MFQTIASSYSKAFETLFTLGCTMFVELRYKKKKWRAVQRREAKLGRVSCGCLWAFKSNVWIESYVPTTFNVRINGNINRTEKLYFLNAAFWRKAFKEWRACLPSLLTCQRIHIKKACDWQKKSLYELKAYSNGCTSVIFYIRIIFVFVLICNRNNARTYINEVFDVSQPLTLCINIAISLEAVQTFAFLNVLDVFQTIKPAQCCI